MFKTMTGCIKGAKMPTDAELKKVPSFMFCKWLSGSKAMIHVANAFNRYSKIPIRCQYLAVKHQFGGKVGYVPFPKKSQLDMNKRIEVIQEMVVLSYDKSVDYLQYISEVEYQKLETSFNLKRTR